MKRYNLSILILFISIQSVFSQSMSGVMSTIPCNNDGVYDVTTTGLTPPITYTYYVNGQSFVHSNVNSTTDQLTNIPMGPWAWISCQARSGSQSAWTSTQFTPSFTFGISVTHPVCPATMGTITATRQGGSTGPFNITWTNKQTQNTYTGSPASVPVGEYSVVIEDQTTGCKLEIVDSAAAVTQLSNVTASISTTVASCTNGTATAVASGGQAPYSYLWANGATTASISGLTMGTYSLTVTDAQGCQSNGLRAYIRQNPTITVHTTPTKATCLQKDGSAIAFGSGGVNPYTYAWSDGQTGQTATNLPGNSSYQVIATDANGCRGQGYAYIQSSTPITATYTQTPSSCTSSTGSATVSYSGGTSPYTVVWDYGTTTGNTISNVSPGSYHFEITDAVGCVRTGFAYVQPISTINAYPYSTPAVCPNNNGTASVSVNGTDPPFTYSWSNGGTSSKITGLSAGSYSCKITDSKGCSVTKYAYVKSSTPLRVSVTVTPASCIFNKDGAATSTVSGGTPPYKYSYTGGSTNANASGLGVGRYWLIVTDANGCVGRRYFSVWDAKTTDNCFCTITGNVYYDANANCTLDAGETGIENIMIHCSGQGYKFTDANGNYSFKVPSGTYTIKEQVKAFYPLASCQSATTSVSVTAASGCSTVVDIANDRKTIHDLKLVTVNSGRPPVPGYAYKQKILVKNDGTVTESNVQMEYEHDGQLSYTSANLSTFLQKNATTAPYAYSVQSGFPTLKPNASSSILVTYNASKSLPLGTKLEFKDTVADKAAIDVNWLLDYSPWNNVNTYEPTVVGSYDPNYKQVYPTGEGEEGFITDEVKEFNYTIHFQNEGTYFARNIYITDQLDTDLDWTTLNPGYSDYDYTVSVTESGLVTFTFADIDLPWKDAYGDDLSSGLVSYSIERKKDVEVGTEFTNTADIYFDFNPPITTNTTLNTLNEITSTGDVDFEESIIGGEVTVDLYPVPANDVIHLRINNVGQQESATMSIIDLMGKVVKTVQLSLNEGSSIISQDVSELANGTYLAMIQMQDGNVITKKMIVY